MRILAGSSQYTRYDEVEAFAYAMFNVIVGQWFRQIKTKWLECCTMVFFVGSSSLSSRRPQADAFM